MPRRPRAAVGILLVCLPGLAGGCGVGESMLPSDFATCSAAARPAAPDGLTYWQDVKPIIDARCTGCHVDGGLAPFSLTTYAAVTDWGDLVADAVTAHRMPPWQPNDCCQAYRWKRSLADDQIATIAAWVTQGMAAGDPAAPGDPIPRDDSELARVDVTMTTAAPYTPVPKIGNSDLRCFVLDWPIDDEVWVTGLAVRPGNPTVVHHVIAYLADEHDTAKLRALDAEDAAPGWDCAGFGLELQPTGYIGGWTPGQRAVTFPGGLGRKVPAHSAVVLQIHYSTAHGFGSDQTSLDVMVEPTVAREARQMGVGNPQWLLTGGLHIAAGDPDAMFTFAFDPTTVAEREGFRIWAVNLHMHVRGRSASLAILHPDGSTECLLDIPAWDLSWMGDYWLTDPIDVLPGDQLYVECHFDNSAANQPIIGGAPATPRDLDWGTDEEMCGGIMTISDRGGDAS